MRKGDGAKNKRRYRRIWNEAQFLDKFIQRYKRVKGRTKFPRKELKNVIPFLFPGSSISGKGAFKIVHKVSATARDLALKTANPQHIKNDRLAYHRLPKNIRNRYFAKIYWATKYCLLQKFGSPGRVPKERLDELRRLGTKHGLTDIRPQNVRKVDGRFKIVDASLSKKKTREMRKQDGAH